VFHIKEIHDGLKYVRSTIIAVGQNYSLSCSQSSIFIGLEEANKVSMVMVCGKVVYEEIVVG